MSSKITLWQRYLAWRAGDGVSREQSEEPVPNKVSADEGDVIRHATSNLGGGYGSNG